MSDSFVIQFTLVDSTRFEEFAPIFDETMPPYIEVGLVRVLSEAQQVAPVDRGIFKGSMQTAIENPAPAQITGVVFDSADYAPIIEGVDDAGNDTEYGRRPGARFPNLTALRGWVERVISPPENQIDEVTYLVGRAIAQRGILAKRPIGNAFDANQDFIFDQIQEGIDATLKQL